MDSGFSLVNTGRKEHGDFNLSVFAPIRVYKRCLMPMFAPLVVLISLLAGCGQTPTPQADGEATATPLAFVVYENEAALALSYPAEWEHVLVSEGLLLFGEPETISLERSGASVTVYRLPASSATAEMPQIFQHYVANGPLQSGYQAVAETQPGVLGGREALELTVEKGPADDQPAMRAFITSAQAESGAIYILAASAPQADWDAQWRTFQILLQSVEFNE